ncbi:MAG: amidohydrolase, partial [Patescibacteria group bacterium]
MHDLFQQMILFKNFILITQNKQREIIQNGGLVIDRDKIVDLGKSSLIERKYRKSAKKIIEGAGHLVMPGLINAHGHLAMTLLRGYADDLPLEEWWFKHVYPVESKFTRQEVYWGSLLAMVEMLKSGTTCFVDFYYYGREVVKAAQEIGMRGIVGYALLDLPTFRFKNAQEALAVAQSAIDRYQKKKLIKVALAPHMFQTTSLKTYQAAKKMTKQNNLLLTTHLAETKAEVDFSLKKYKVRPIEVLAKAGILDSKTLLVHGCWLNKKEIAILAEKNSSVVHCPVSNMKLASGIMPLPEMMEAGVNVCLGTDSACSNNNLDMFEEMKVAALLHKINKLDPTAAKAQTILDMATINGAKALNLEKEIGSLEKGKQADLIILDFEKSHLIPHHNLISHLVYSAQGSDVETVLINGRKVMEKRRIKGVNQKKLLRRIKNLALILK